jgi:nitrate/nitrite transporter NarK
MLLQSNFAQSLQSPVVRIFLVVIAIALLYVLGREVRKIPAKLLTLMATAFVDMVGVLMIFPLLPFYVKTLGGSGVDFGFHIGIGTITALIISSFTVAQLLSAPLWGKFSDRVGRRPTLLPDLWFRRFALVAVAVAHRTGRRRRNGRCDSGIRG